MSIKRPILTSVVIIIVIILGLGSYLRLGVELFPDVEFPMIVVTTTYQGAGPEEIERLVTKEIEDTVTLVDNMKYIESTSSEGLSTVMLEFNMGTDLDVAANDVRDRVGQVESALPDDADDPVITKVDPNAFPILRLSVAGDMTLRRIYEIADDRIRTELGKIPGVGLIRIVGGREREIRVAVDLDKLNSYKLSVGQVISAVAASNLEIPAGHITRETVELAIRLPGEFDSLKKIRMVGIPGSGGSVRIGDVAEVKDTVAEIRRKARHNENPSVGIEILKQGDANTIEVGRRVREAVDKLNRGQVGEGVVIDIVTDDSVFIRDVVDEVNLNIIEGIILTALALFLFLHNWRGTFVTALAMPASVVATFLLLYFAGYSINIMTMMGLAISVGIIVNNSILVLENIDRYLDLGEDPKTAAAKGTSEIALAVTSTTLTNVVVFLPIAFMESIVGQIFRQFAMTVVFATFFSLFMSLTLTPMLSALLFRKRTERNARVPDALKSLYTRWDGFYDDLTDSYGRLVSASLRHPWVVLLAAALIFGVSMKTLPGLIGGEFFPKVDEGRFMVNVETDVSRSLSYTDRVIREVEEAAREIPETEDVYSTIGRATQGDMGGASDSVNLGQVVVKLVDLDNRTRSTDQVMESLRPRLARIVGADFTVSSQAQGGPGAKPVEIEVMGENVEIINRIVDEIMLLGKGGAVQGRKYEPIEGLVGLDTNWRKGKPEIRLEPDRDMLRRYGLSVKEVAETLRAYYTGVVQTKYREGDNEYDIRVRLPAESKDDMAVLERLSVFNADGDPVNIDELTDRRMASGPNQLFRKDRQHMIKVTGEVAGGRTVGEVYEDYDRRIRELKLPEGYSYQWAGEIEMMRENFGDIYQALIIAIVLTYLMLSGILESWKLSLLIMLSLPLSFVGVFLALLLRGSTMNVFSLMGMVMLVGLVINNAIVVLDYVVALRKDGMSLKKAIVKGCKVRLRPLMMANLTTVVAMVPLAMGIGAGGEYRAPMAVTQMGGILAGGILALIVIPPLYYLVERRKERRAQEAS